MPIADAKEKLTSKKIKISRIKVNWRTIDFALKREQQHEPQIHYRFLVL